MHCIEIQATSLGNFKARISKLGAQVSIVSRYTERGVRLLDVEVSKDTIAIDRLEKSFKFVG